MQVIKNLFDLLYPRKCKVCGRILLSKEEHLCLHCLKDIPLTYYWDWEGNPAESILWGRTYVQWIVPLFFYRRESPYSQLLHRIKYKGDIKLAHYLGRMLGEYLKESKRIEAEEIDYLVPVPLHPRKKWKRGYNQAEEIAKGIGTALWGAAYANKRIVTDAIKRSRYTKTQTKIKVDSKWKNIEGAFALKRPERLIGKQILLIDDVLTTGATVEACYEKLKLISEIKVSVATLAYVEQNH